MTQRKVDGKKDVLLGGWPQFTTQKSKMVNDFKSSRDMSENRPTDTDKGKHAEALFRDWLEQFLPAKYSVTSGYIISQGDSVLSSDALKGKLRHYDVIIYNRLDSPVLWTEMSPDHSQSGRIKAIPAEYVHGVLEMKSSFNGRSIADALKKLNELTPLLGLDEPNERYKQFIPANFYMGLVFFTLSEKEQKKLDLLNKLMPGTFPRGFHGGIVLSADGLDQRNTGRFAYFPEGGSPMYLAKPKGRTLISPGGMWSDSKEISPGEHIVCIFDWSESNFALFAFELIEVMNGTYRLGTLASKHGLRLQLG